MMNCWQSEPEARPLFSDLTQQLKRMENQHKVRLISKLFNKEFPKENGSTRALHQAGKLF